MKNGRLFILSLMQIGAISVLERDDSYLLRPHPGWEEVKQSGGKLQCCGKCLHKIDDPKEGIICPVYNAIVKEEEGNKCGSYLTQIQKRLSRIVVENKDSKGLVKVYDKPDALFYLDLTYYGTERYYQDKFDEEDHIRLCDTLDNLHGKFILSYNNCSFIRDMYRDYHVEPISPKHNLRSRYDEGDKSYGELIIRNY